MNADPIDPSAMVDSLVPKGGPPVSNAEGSPVLVKRCACCQVQKHADEFTKNKHGPGGLGSYCKACHNQMRREWRASHPDQLRQINAKWKQKHPDKVHFYDREYRRAWRAAHPEHRIAQRKSAQLWNRNNPVKVKTFTLNYRAKKRNAPGADYTTAQHIKWRWEMWGGRCWICGAPATCTDHVKALAVGGSHWPANLRPCCGPCNSSKGAKRLITKPKKETP